MEIFLQVEELLLLGLLVDVNVLLKHLVMLLAGGKLLLEYLDLDSALCDVVVSLFIVHFECTELLHALIVTLCHLFLKSLDFVRSSADSGLHFSLFFFALSEILVELLALLADLTEFGTVLILVLCMLMGHLADL